VLNGKGNQDKKKKSTKDIELGRCKRFPYMIFVGGNGISGSVIHNVWREERLDTIEDTHFAFQAYVRWFALYMA